MKLFGWKSAGRASSRPAHFGVPLGRVNSGVVAGQWPRSYEAQLREGYVHNAIAQRAVRLVAEGAASTVLKASDDRALALVRATTHGQSLMETLAAQLLLHGNGYVQLLLDTDGQVSELYALRPERMAIEPDARGWPAAFRYKVGESVTRLAQNEVIHIRSHHPLDDHYGLGCLAAATGAIAIHNASAQWNKALLDNAARPSGALVHEGAETLTADQFNRLQDELLKGFQGAAQAGKPMLLEGGLRWQSLSLSPTDMDFAGLKAAAAREIALAFGVPPMLLGLPGDATYANYREANKALWRQTILPLAGKILDALAQGLAPHFPGMTLGIDMDQLPALAEDRERLWTQLESASFLTRDEKRVGAGFPALGEEAPIEVKFNPWHDTANGQFADAGSGKHYGAPVARAVAGKLLARSVRKPASPKPPKLKPSKPTAPFRGGGGSFGGGGASGSWEPQKPKPLTPSKPDRATKLKSPGFDDISDIPKPSRFRPATPPKAGMRRISKNGYDFDLDDNNRTRVASGTLRLDPTQTRSKTNQRQAGGK